MGWWSGKASVECRSQTAGRGLHVERGGLQVSSCSQGTRLGPMLRSSWPLQAAHVIHRLLSSSPSERSLRTEVPEHILAQTGHLPAVLQLISGSLCLSIVFAGWKGE